MPLKTQRTKKEIIKDQIINRLKNLEDEEVSIRYTDKKNTVVITCTKEHALNFKFKWTNNSHFSDFFVDNHW